MNTNFADNVVSAYKLAVKKAFPFVPSRKEIEDELQIIINQLISMGTTKAEEYIRASFTHTGYEAIAVSMYKQAKE